VNGIIQKSSKQKTRLIKAGGTEDVVFHSVVFPHSPDESLGFARKLVDTSIAIFRERKNPLHSYANGG
jgi:hypothetical protein